MDLRDSIRPLIMGKRTATHQRPTAGASPAQALELSHERNLQVLTLVVLVFVWLSDDV